MHIVSRRYLRNSDAKASEQIEEIMLELFNDLHENKQFNNSIVVN